MASESVQKTLGVALVLCIVCAVVVSSAAVILRPTQEENKLLDLKTNILASAGLLQVGVDVEKQFEQISTRVVDLKTGRFTDAIDPVTFDQRKSSKDPAMSTALDPSEDLAKIKRRENYATVYIVEGEQGIEKIVLPIKGYGLWSTLYGFWLLSRIYRLLPELGFMNMPRPPDWAVKSIILTGRQVGLESKLMILVSWQSVLSRVKLILQGLRVTTR